MGRCPDSLLLTIGYLKVAKDIEWLKIISLPLAIPSFPYFWCTILRI